MPICSSPEDTQKPEYGKLLQRVQERSVDIHRHLLFFTLEIVAIPDDVFAGMLADPVTASYRHYLEHTRAMRPHRLSEPEEQILMEKSLTGREAFSRLFDELVNAMGFTMTVDGKRQTLSESEVLNKLSDPGARGRARLRRRRRSPAACGAKRGASPSSPIR